MPAADASRRGTRDCRPRRSRDQAHHRLEAHWGCDFENAPPRDARTNERRRAVAQSLYLRTMIGTASKERPYRPREWLSERRNEGAEQSYSLWIELVGYSSNALQSIHAAESQSLYRSVSASVAARIKRDLHQPIATGPKGGLHARYSSMRPLLRRISSAACALRLPCSAALRYHSAACW